MQTTIIAVMLLMLPVWCKGQELSYHIEGTVGVDTGEVILQYNRGNRTYVRQQANISAGRFVLEGTINAPYKAVLMLQRKNDAQDGGSFEFFLDSGLTVIHGPRQISRSIASGSKLCGEATEYSRLMTALNEKFEPSFQELEKQQGDEKRQPATEQAAAALYDSFALEQKRLHADFIASHPGSRLNLYIFRELSYLFEYHELADLFALVLPDIKNSSAGLAYAARLERLKAVAKGQLAPDFTQPDTSGRLVSLSSFKGKYVLLDFWASWCGPCRAESPYLVAAYEKFSRKGFEIVGLSLDKKAYHNLWRQAIRKDRLFWTQLSDGSDNNPAVELYGVKGIPQNFLIDPQGRIIAHNLRGISLEQTLEGLIK